MNQKELIAQFIKDTKMKMNPDLFVRSNDEIMEQLKIAIKSCERNGAFFSIHINGFTVVDDYDEINRILYNYYEQAYRNKTKAKRKDNRYEYINLNESDIRLLIVHYLIADKESHQDLDVIIAVPRIVDNYYVKIDGIMRSTLFQIVDGSTYNNSTSMSKSPSVIMKLIFMAVRVFRTFVNLPLPDKSEVKATYYTAFSFNKTVGAMKYILAGYGYYGALNFFGNEYIWIKDHPSEDPRIYSFKKSENLYVLVPKMLFDNDLVTQSLVATIYLSIHGNISIEHYFQQSYWIRSIGADFNKLSLDKFSELYTNPDKTTVVDTYAKGEGILISFQSIYDSCTREVIRLPKEDKESMYTILRWMIREFNNLRMKDNLDISTKRIRFAEYIASLYVMKIAKGIYRVADMNKKANLDSIIKAIRTDPLYLLKSIVMSKMINYRNMVSDMDSMLALKYTYKGVSGLGESGNKSIPDIYRSINPSHIGRIDLDASSDTNPGITGCLNPFTDIRDGYFNPDYEEPNTWAEAFANLMNDFQSARKLKSAMEFQQSVLGVDNHEQIGVTDDVICNMEQIINPIRGLIEPMIFDDL